MTYGKRLKAAREHAKLNQVQLAAKSSVSQQTISKIERGKQDGSMYTVHLATACGVRPEWLASENGDMLEAGTPTPRVEQPAATYLDADALDVARAWSKLSPLMKTLYRDAIFRDAAVEKIMPWLKLARPRSASYDAFQQAVEQNYHQHQKQLKLKLDA